MHPVLSLEPMTTKFPQASLVPSDLPLPWPRVSGYKHNFVQSFSFRGSLCLQPALPGRQEPCWFSQLEVIWVPFSFWCCSLGIPAWVIGPTLLRGNPLATEISIKNFSRLLWEPSQPPRASSAFPTSLVVVKWFLLSLRGYQASFQLVFSWLFRMISPQFSCNSRLALGGG